MGLKETEDISFVSRWFSPIMMYGVWLLVLAVTVLHYMTCHDVFHVHDILRRAYYIPIVIASFRLGITGGLFVAGIVTLAYLPHAFLLPVHFDPARESEKMLEIILYFSVGAIAGYLSDREKKYRRRLEKALEEQKQLSEQIIRAGRLSALGETVAGIAHEIRNPLHSMAGSLEILDPLIDHGTEERKIWEIHKAEVSRLIKISKRFLSFSRPAPSEMLKIDIADIIKRIQELASAQAKRQKVELRVIAPSKPILIIGDRDQLAQIGMNICLNAFRAIGEKGGVVSLKGDITNTSDKMAILVIENSGPKVLTSEIESIFDPFHSCTGSTGLGLSISSRIAQEHGGYITVENGGLGVKFILWLPYL